jgi:hypothetical protein
LRSLLRQFPAVTLLGPRQIGKSTFARWALPDFEFLDLEDARDFDRIAADPLLAISQHRRLVLDEAQRLPSLFPVLRAELDRDPRRKVVLLGSASPGLVERISESLAGRTGLLELGGISIFEHPAERLWIYGGYPRVHWSRPRARPSEWYPAYLRTVIERDIPQLGFRVAATRLRNLLTMVAHVQGGVCNLSDFASSLGVNYHAVAHTLDILEGVFLLRRLPPYFANIGKRLVKSPKIYLRDSGVLHSLLGLPFSKAALLRHPKAGPSFETFAIEQILLHAGLADPGARGFFFRTHAGVEVDLLLELRGRLIPIEVKLGLGHPDTRALVACMEDLGLERGYVVRSGGEPREIRRGIWTGGLGELIELLGLRPRSAR